MWCDLFNGMGISLNISPFHKQKDDAANDERSADYQRWQAGPGLIHEGINAFFQEQAHNRGGQKSNQDIEPETLCRLV